MKNLSLLLSMVNSVVSSLILLSCVSRKNLHWDALGRISGRVLTGFLVLLIGMLTFRDGVRSLRPEKLLIAGLLLIMLGVSCTAWGLHLSLLSGDVKTVFIVYGGSLVVQGITSIGGIYESQDSTIARNGA